MYLYASLLQRAQDSRPVRAGLIGAGKFGSMFLSQTPTTPGLEITVIADLNPDGAKAACRAVGWTDEQVNATTFLDNGLDLISRDDVDVVIEATGHPPAGIAHARAAARNGKHIIMVNVEADVLAGPLLAQEARAAGLVYAMAYGDQPALTAEMVDWARSCGFEVIAAGKGTKYLPEYHAVTPDGVWEHYGLTADEAKAAGMNSQMFNSFLDGTKSAIEMAAIANACDLMPAPDGLQFPPCGMDELADTLCPTDAGGVLHHKGQVEVVSSLNRDGSPVSRDLRWGVYCVFEAPNDYAAACFRQYGMNTDASGRYSAMYKPFHLIGLELNISVLAAGLEGKATGQARAFNGDAVAIAKRSLKAGEMLDGEGGYTVWGKLLPAATSLKKGALPIGLASAVNLKRDIPAGEIVGWADVDIDESAEPVQIRREMERRFGEKE